jgi:hypothetical protein
MVVGATMGGPAVIASTGRRDSKPIRLWPHLQARILPSGGPGGHYRYPEPGVPLLQDEEAVLVRRSLATR